MKSALGGLISRLDITEERISEFENMWIETFKSEKKKRLKTWNKISNNSGAIHKLKYRFNENIKKRNFQKVHEP